MASMVLLFTLIDTSTLTGQPGHGLAKATGIHYATLWPRDQAREQGGRRSAKSLSPIAGVLSPSKSPGAPSGLNIHAAEFRPHIHTDKHLEQHEAFKQYLAFYEEHVAPRLLLCDGLRVQLDNIKAGMWLLVMLVVASLS